ncbi:type I methionyl aminopeptidase [[Mycoplasma] mobile]|uniref:Methionine aminopeptidase n=1 Tax=Mycoplasma mobile (strain ATCC 43663 / 163K / NCTC 11711) TaxID=267748 RepID=Q6KI34_MYCM1|nr:type I methionyl aminopeptidase [[Mycoplasma] mobile]AAT27742.1 methionine aminopeptidase [Mycoplasma mobile 163K]
MIKIKNQQEILKIRKSCKILAEIKEIIYNLVRPGISLKELDQVAFEEILKRKVKPAFLGYHGFPNSTCLSVNEELIHGIPSNYILKEGDLLKVDMGIIYDSYYSDSAFTISVGTQTNTENNYLINAAKEAFYEGIKAIKPGSRIGDIEDAIGRYLAKNNLYTPDEFSGHGIGKNLHEDPIVANKGKKNKGPLLKDGMVICIEPMIMQDNNDLYIKDDGWTVVCKSGKKSSHYEHTVLIENGKAIILTEGI